jgi:ABC-type Fe3+-hydroxamate transport system substrate-binding protein
MEGPLEAPPRRVLALVPSLTLTLFELKLGDRVVGVTDYCTEPADRLARLPRVGGPRDPDIERILALGPDLVMAGQDENRREDVDALRNAGVPVWVISPKTVREVIDLLWAMMRAFDEPSMVPRVRLIEQTLDHMESAAANREACGVFVPVWRDPWMTFSRDTYVHDLLRVCGGWNVFAEREVRYFPVTLDEVTAARPEVVLLPSKPYAFGAEAAAEMRALDIPAARNGRIHLVDGSLLFWYGTRTARGLSELPPLLATSQADRGDVAARPSGPMD